MHRFQRLVKLKLALPLAQMDAAHEDMERFLQNRLGELRSQTGLRSLIDSLSERITAHQSRIRQIVCSEPLRHDEVAHQIFMGIVAEQPMETNVFPRVLEGLLGRLGIAAPGEMDPPASSKEGAARL